MAAVEELERLYEIRLQLEKDKSIALERTMAGEKEATDLELDRNRNLAQQKLEAAEKRLKEESIKAQNDIRQLFDDEKKQSLNLEKKLETELAQANSNLQ